MSIHQANPESFYGGYNEDAISGEDSLSARENFSKPSINNLELASEIYQRDNFVQLSQAERQFNNQLKKLDKDTASILNSFSVSDTTNSTPQENRVIRVADKSSSFFSGWSIFGNSDNRATEKASRYSAERCTMDNTKSFLSFSDSYQINCPSSGPGNIKQSWFPFRNSFTLSVQDRSTGQEIVSAQSSRQLTMFGPTTFKVTDNKGEILAYINRESTQAANDPKQKPSTTYTIRDARNNVIARTPAIPFGKDSFQILADGKEIATIGQGWASKAIPLISSEYWAVNVQTNNKISPQVLLILQALHMRQARKQISQQS